VLRDLFVIPLPWLEHNATGGGLPIRGYGFMLLVGFVAGVTLAARQARRMGLNPDLIYSFAFWIFVAGILGARTFFVIQYREQFWRESTLAMIGAVLNLTEGGLVVYGAFLGVMLAGTIYLIVHKLPVLAFADLIAPSLALGLAFGRIGCLLNGCCFGGLCDTPWLGVQFPPTSPVYERQLELGQLHGFRLEDHPETGRPQVAAVYPDTPAQAAGMREGMIVRAINGQSTPTTAHARQVLRTGWSTLVVQTERSSLTVFAPSLPARSLPVHATQIYSAVNAALLFFLLWTYYPLRRRDGEVFAILLLLYPITRWILEAVRVDEAGKLGTSLTIAQWVSLLLIAGAIALWIYVLRQPAGSVLPLPQESASPMQEGLTKAVDGQGGN
jgi:phosphatidylglycerol---prolipoprotein diacylglyceryl transferase